ncbi:hypothetical protein C8J57DRAFT_1255453 [Mycena rebaudengoi]|nr:hypothetical protein C8J57DRAFT_1255453 [Mycena rebaudengoi]
MPAANPDDEFDAGRAALVSLTATIDKVPVCPETTDLRFKLVNQLGDRAAAMFPHFEDMFEDAVFRDHMFNARTLLNKLKLDYPQFKHPSTLVRELHNFLHRFTTTRDERQKEAQDAKDAKAAKAKAAKDDKAEKAAATKAAKSAKGKKVCSRDKIFSRD